MMKTLEKRAQEAMGRLVGRGRTTRIPDDVRAAVVAFAGEARKTGATWKQIGDRVGLSASVVQRWSRAASPSAVWSAIKVTRDVVTDDKTAGLVLITPGGYRVEGLSLDAVERVIAHLG
jgi:hypothetical protein